ncbi:MAG: pitrilysin family protein, partial [Candidatus Vogelbacteria bacterium]|nr:pitrilysin family protein [Candidatus Vogelbacteria bacterium]
MYHRTTLKNGLRIITVPKKDSLSVNLLVLVSVGTDHETKAVNGISHFLEHMSFKGTAKRPRAIDLSSELDSLGAEYNAFTGREYTGYYVSCLPDKLDQALDILADMYLNPFFDEHEADKERGVIGEEINRSFDNPSRRVQDIFSELIYGDTSYGWSTLGTKATLKDINRPEFLAFRKKHYHAKNTVVAIAGDLEHLEITAKVERYFSALAAGRREPKEKIIERQTKPALRLEFHPGQQTNIVLGFRSVGSSHKDYYPALILAGILGGTMSSRLFQKVREEMGAAYSIGAYQASFAKHGYLGISAGVETKRLEEVLRVILAETAKLKVDLVDEKELARTKDVFIGSTYL